MDFSQSEVKTINQSIKFVNQWVWYKWVLLLTSVILISFTAFLVSSTNYGKYAWLVSLLIGLLLGYLSRNWEKPKKEALLLRLLQSQKNT